METIPLLVTHVLSRIKVFNILENYYSIVTPDKNLLFISNRKSLSGFYKKYRDMRAAIKIFIAKIYSPNITY